MRSCKARALILSIILLSLPHNHICAQDIKTEIEFLKKHGQSTDTPALLDLIRKYTPDTKRKAQIHQWIEQLGNRSYQKRERATEALIQLGPLAKAALLKSAKDKDRERAKRAQRCLEHLAQGTHLALLESAIRIVGHRKAEDAIKVLLDFIPSVTANRLKSALIDSLSTLALHTKDHSRFESSLKAEHVIERTISSIAMAFAGERKAIPVLIAVLDDLPVSDHWLVEETLFRLSGENSPSPPADDSQASLKKYQRAWQQWWQKHQLKVDLAVLQKEAHLFGRTLLVLLDKNIVCEVDRNGKTLWEIKNLKSPVDAHVLPGRRVLITEYRSSTISERTFDGKILWKKATGTNPCRAERLPNGQTLITTRKRLFLTDKAGKEQELYKPTRSIHCVKRFRDGRIACIVSKEYQILNAEGKVLKKVANVTSNTTSCLDTVINGNIVVSEQSKNRVIEMTPSGKIVWQQSAQAPSSVARLPNGNTLICQNDGTILEYTKSNKLVKRFKVQGRPIQIRGR